MSAHRDMPRAQDAPGALLTLREVSRRFERPQGLLDRLSPRRLGGRSGDAGPIVAVDGVSLEVHRREVVGLVGESGCGKSTLARMAVGLQPLSSGSRLWKDEDFSGPVGPQQARRLLDMQMVFQDATASLNPRLRVRDIVGEAPVAHGFISPTEQSSCVADLLERVGLEPDWMRRFPHQFSGGQRARIGIARALAVHPQLLICDESVAALDVSIQAQILNLFLRLRDELGLAYLFISHDLSVVRHIADRVLVMYLGRIVESGPAEAVFTQPNHPYTIGLLDAIPTLETPRGTARRFQPVRGELPSPLSPPPGCHFHPRCPHAMDRCRKERPLLKHVAPGRASACHLNDG